MEKSIRRKRCVASFMILFFLVGIFSLGQGYASAAANENIDLKIGLFYASTAKSSVTVTAQNGFIYACQKSDDSVNNMWQNPADTSVTVSKYTGYYVKLQKSGLDYTTAKTLAAKYPNAYPGNVNGSTCVVIANYASLATAQIAAEALNKDGVTATACNIDANLVLVKNTTGAFAFSSTDGYLVLKPISTNVVTINSTSYNGSVLFKRLSNSDMTVINIVNMYDYLASVIGQEMSPSWPAEALKAQTVAAKCYALVSLTRYKDYGFTMDAPTNCQVYMGTSKVTDSTRAAVNATKGVMALYNGQVAQTFFYSCDGGLTESSEYVWGNAFPYLTGVKDTYEKADGGQYARWTVTLTKGDIATKLKNKGVDLGDITSIQITARTPVGRVKELTITGTNGSKAFTKTTCYSILGLKSSNYSIVGGGATTTNSATGETSYVAVKGEGSTEMIPQSGLTAVTKNGTEQVSGSLSVATKNGIVTLTPTESASTTTGDTAVSGDSFTFSGGSWGHGVGMSQWGAKAMADAGFTYKDILAFYFKGITFSN